MRGRTLALSDLHLGRRTTRIKSAEALAPLIEGFDRVLLLGDVLDEWYLPPARAHEIEAHVRAVCARGGARQVVWFRGNHDANLPQGEEYALLDGVLYMHGHAIYNRLPGHGPLRQRIRALDRGEFGPHRLGSRTAPKWRLFELAYRVPHVLIVPLLWRQSIRRRLLAIITEVRREGPVRAVVLGHSHAPGLRRLDGLPVFNLGGWLRNTRACGFWLEHDVARLVRIQHRRGVHGWGKLWREVVLPTEAPAPK